MTFKQTNDLMKLYHNLDFKTCINLLLIQSVVLSNKSFGLIYNWIQSKNGVDSAHAGYIHSLLLYQSFFSSAQHSLLLICPVDKNGIFNCQVHKSEGARRIICRTKYDKFISFVEKMLRINYNCSNLLSMRTIFRKCAYI